jgi:hypothetical protein
MIGGADYSQSNTDERDLWIEFKPLLMDFETSSESEVLCFRDLARGRETFGVDET